MGEASPPYTGQKVCRDLVGISQSGLFPPSIAKIQVPHIIPGRGSRPHNCRVPAPSYLYSISSFYSSEPWSFSVESQRAHRVSSGSPLSASAGCGIHIVLSRATMSAAPTLEKLVLRLQVLCSLSILVWFWAVSSTRLHCQESLLGENMATPLLSLFPGGRTA